MNIYYLTKKGNEQTDLNGDSLSIDGVTYSFTSTTYNGFDYKVAVANGSQLILDKLNASQTEQVIDLETYNSI